MKKSVLRHRCVGSNNTVCLCRGSGAILSSWSNSTEKKLFKLNLQRGVSVCCWSYGLGGPMQSPHSSSQWSFLQVFYIHYSRAYNMSSVLFCWVKPVNICPCSTCKIVLLSGSSLSSSTPTDIVSLFLDHYHHISFHCLHFLYILFPLSLVFSFSLFFLSVSWGTGALSVHYCHGNNDGKTRWRSHCWPGLLYRGGSCVWKHQMLSLKFKWTRKLKITMDISNR